MTSLQGFGSADVTTPFHYGSVVDGIHHNPTLEQKLKKKYWKTKQTVIQKLHKSQDEFVIAGDADIDTKLEVGSQLTPFDPHVHYCITSCCGSLPAPGCLPPALLLSSTAANTRKILFQTQRY